MDIKVGVKEFREKLPSYLDARSPVAITRHGETIGYYIPARQERPTAELDALKEASAKLDRMLADKGVSEDELVAEFKARRAAG